MDDRISKLKRAEELLNEAADLMGEALHMSGMGDRDSGDIDTIRRIASSKEYSGSILNLIKDMEYASSEQPGWTQPFTSPKNVFPSDDDRLLRSPLHE